MTDQDFFADDPAALSIYEALRAEALRLEGTTIRPARSQVGFSRSHPFAAVWRPRLVLGHGAPAALSIFLDEKIASARWKEVVEPAPGRFTHHLELYRPEDVDETVKAWLKRAWSRAG